MPRAEKGTPKYLANKMKAKGLQRLRWYCQACEKQCRDENGFKCHTQSESHVRQMHLMGENMPKYLADYSNQFKKDFLQLLRTSHAEKKVHVNRFYQEYIRDKNHIHMNATRWKTLSEFCKYLGREGICKVDYDDSDGFSISYIDQSPETLERKAQLVRLEKAQQTEESIERKLMNEHTQKSEALKAVTDLKQPSILKKNESQNNKPLRFQLTKQQPNETTINKISNRKNVFRNSIN